MGFNYVTYVTDTYYRSSYINSVGNSETRIRKRKMTAAEALTALRDDAGAYSRDTVTAWDVASRVTGFDPHGRPLTPTPDTLTRVRRELARLEREGRVWSHVTRGMERVKHGSRRKISVSRKWYSTTVRAP